MQQRPLIVHNDNIKVLKELIAQHYEFELCIYMMYVNGIEILTSIDKTIKSKSLVRNTSRKPDKFYEALDKIVYHYHRAGFLFSMIHCDREFKPLMYKVDVGLNVTMNYTTTNNHVPQNEITTSYLSASKLISTNYLIKQCREL